MAWELRIDTKVKVDMLACDEGAREEIRSFVSGLEDNAYPVGCEELEPLIFCSRLQCGYFIAWEAILHRSKPVSIKEPELAAVRVLGVGKNSPQKRVLRSSRSGGRFV